MACSGGQTAGTFAGAQWSVVGDVSAPVNTNEYVTIRAEDTNGDFHQLERNDSGSWVNWATGHQAWPKDREVGMRQAADYTIKVNADVVSTVYSRAAWLSSRKLSCVRSILCHG